MDTFLMDFKYYLQLIIEQKWNMISNYQLKVTISIEMTDNWKSM